MLVDSEHEPPNLRDRSPGKFVCLMDHTLAILKYSLASSLHVGAYLCSVPLRSSEILALR